MLLNFNTVVSFNFSCIAMEYITKEIRYSNVFTLSSCFECCHLFSGRWCQKDLIPIVQEANNNNYARDVSDGEFRLVYDGYPAPVIQKSRL